MYEGKWPNDADGNPCPEPEVDDGGDDVDSSAATLLAGAIVLAAAMLF